MADLTKIPTGELRAELHRREQENYEWQRQAMNAKFGPCPECGGEIASAESNVVHEHYVTPKRVLEDAAKAAASLGGEPYYPLLIPVGGPGALAGVDMLATFRCQHGHEWHLTKTVFYDEPIEPLFA